MRTFVNIRLEGNTFYLLFFAKKKKSEYCGLDLGNMVFDQQWRIASDKLLSDQTLALVIYII